MGQLYEELTPDLVKFIERQKMFFVGSAPLTAQGHVNISPKGMDCLRVLDNNTLAYLDVSGSGVETLAHVKENARMVIMFCAFEGKPLTLRVHGEGEVIETHQAGFSELLKQFPRLPAVRSIIRLKANRIADSCGWTVPLYDYVGMRDYYDSYAEKAGDAGIRKGQLASNMKSIDGLAGLEQPSV